METITVRNHGIDVISLGASTSTAVPFLYGDAQWVNSNPGGFDATAWHLYTIVATASGAQFVYVDGSLINSGTYNVILPASGLGMNIGKTDRPAPYQYFTKGDIDEVRVLNTPLSSAWIA